MIISCGLNDASGDFFKPGVNTVTYTVQDQPILLITEVIEDGTFSGIELTNFGPASLDISCLNIVREGLGDTTIVVPNGTIIGVGETYTQTFDAIAAVVKKWRWIPEFRFVNQYHDDTGYIEALAASIREAWN